jgi:hypothetical protein
MGKKLSRVLGVLVPFVLLPIAILLLIEGASSIIVAIHDVVLFSEPVAAERKYTQYDSELGWVSRPNFYVENMYGPGVYLKTNSQGFRSDEDYTEKIPDGYVRAICSGDSFTLGYGVSNKDTWCSVLEILDPRLQTVNMGQGGYGIDQMYMWYMREGLKLQHNVHILAFILSDFDRVTATHSFGYGKPRFVLENDEIKITNVPVPQDKFQTMPALLQNVGMLKSFRSLQLMRRMKGERETELSLTQQPDLNESVKISFKILDRLQRQHINDHRAFFIVYLPTMADYMSHSSDEFLKGIDKAFTEAGTIFINLVPHFRMQPAHKVRQFFIQSGQLPEYPYSEGHYTAKGNRFVATLIYGELRNIYAKGNPIATATRSAP